ncbi:branched-chain amino acid ABC transporter permease [Desulfosporosinus sp. BICA1-9]|uniref:branched-chain amino acid ABC transporter permease n=1 Tax=Desulfosporosinus sp. BICA1-9 TaxID=1531958 RepID=UPI00054BA930|nr:branched-chain amino acid ABC transporter permease [Desulfosporosinus sp. BICA1-9]KJS46912.1 MAG: branched-chain amino acid ABC transporter permease [Peptococcaceae bacterium BRH_c23]KJS87783.1 MAG: branched-chain amino acid ABC transporter permease [Desulfosporosinus sp. BICA1-9]HBW38050.1 branched-chain amino acid ABC transporter permease [Desulfosporosinus sp.]
MTGVAILQATVDGLLMGGVYAVTAVGLTLIFGVMEIVNFAHGALMMLGMYITYWLCTLFGINPYLTIPISVVVLFSIGFLIQRYLLNQIIKAPQHNQLLLTLGIMLFIENLALFLWTPDTRSIQIPGLEKSIMLGELAINKPKLFAFVIALVVTVILYIILRKTTLGRAIRATSQEREGACLVGIKVRNINAVAFGIGAACAGVAGSIILPFFFASPTVGGVFLLRSFVVAILGGLGNFWGALVAGLIIGLSESLSGLFLSGSWNDLVIYGIFILVLFLRPTGLFGGGQVSGSH